MRGMRVKLASFLAPVAVLAMASVSPASAEGLKGDYLETRTCDVYTGPCFANGQVGLTGNDAIMAGPGNDTVTGGLGSRMQTGSIQSALLDCYEAQVDLRDLSNTFSSLMRRSAR